MGLRIFLAVALVVPLGSQLAHAEPGDDLTISALTFGPGDHPFFKFGHNAILVQSTKEEGGQVFNFGTFAFDSPGLVFKFLAGRFKYWLSVASMEDTFASYIYENRTIEAQELDLSPSQKWALWNNLRENARPENREYLYDYFGDNCSTRVRDAIDRVVGGRVEQAGQMSAATTLRREALRMTADYFPEYLGLNLGLGRSTDAPITLWDASFLPERMRDLLRHVRIAGEGGDRPLVKNERIMFAARRSSSPAQPPSWWPYFLLAGMAFGGLLAGLGRLGAQLALARVLLGTTGSLLGLGFGLLGIILLALWAFTDHKAAHNNANIFLLAPWSVVLVGYGIAVALGRPRAMRRAFWVAASAAGFAVLGLVVKAVPGYSQANLVFVAFLLPVWLGLAAGFHWSARH